MRDSILQKKIQRQTKSEVEKVNFIFRQFVISTILKKTVFFYSFEFQLAYSIVLFEFILRLSLSSTFVLSIFFSFCFRKIVISIQFTEQTKKKLLVKSIPSREPLQTNSVKVMFRYKYATERKNMILLIELRV